MLTIHTIEEQDGAAEDLAFVNGLERARGRGIFRIHQHFPIARLEFFHAAAEDDTTPVDEHHIGKDVLNLVDLMGGDDDGAAAIEVVVQERIVELLAKEDVEAECRLIEHQQFGVNGHDQGKV